MGHLDELAAVGALACEQGCEYALNREMAGLCVRDGETCPHGAGHNAAIGRHLAAFSLYDRVVGGARFLRAFPSVAREEDKAIKIKKSGKQNKKRKKTKGKKPRKRGAKNP